MASLPDPKEKALLVGQIPLAQRYRAVQGMARAIGNNREAEGLFRALVHELRAVFNSRTIGIVHYDHFFEAVQWCAFDIEDYPLSFTPLVQWENSACRWVYEHQQPLIIDLSSGTVPFTSTVECLTQFGMLSACVLPLTTAHRHLGAIIFASQDDGYYSEDMVHFLSLVADQVALAMDHVFNSAALQLTRTHLQNETAKLKVLLELNNAIVSDLQLTSLLQVVSPCIRSLIPVDAVALILPDSQGNKLRLHALDFPNQNNCASGITSLDYDTVAAKVFRSGQPWIGHLQNFHTAGEYNPAPAAVAELQTMCALPLARRNRVLGVLGLGRLQKTAFEQDDVEFLLQVANQVAIAVDNALTYDQIAHSHERLTPASFHLEKDFKKERQFEKIVGQSDALRRVLQQAKTVAPAQTTVLIGGETGTGKELIARAVHDLSPRQGRAFVKVNCAALPAGLLESELFGHEKGAFTGALAQRLGRFELADGGTIFLDEVSELPLELQPKLLRVLQEREFERLGGSKTIRTTARLIAATNCNLASMVAANQFRADLFYRLNVFPLQLPPLRERREDIPLLVHHFMHYFAGSFNKQIDTVPAETMNALTRYAWPGNIRELQNIIERAVILSRGPVLHVSLADLKSNSIENGTSSNDYTLEEVERRHILSVLEQTDWVLSGPNGAAQRLGVKRSTLQFRMQKLGISRSLRHEGQ